MLLQQRGDHDIFRGQIRWRELQERRQFVRRRIGNRRGNRQRILADKLRGQRGIGGRVYRRTQA